MAEDVLRNNAMMDLRKVLALAVAVEGSPGDGTRVELRRPTCDISKKKTLNGAFQRDSEFGVHFKVCHTFLNL